MAILIAGLFFAPGDAQADVVTDNLSIRAAKLKKAAQMVKGAVRVTNSFGKLDYKKTGGRR